MPELRSALFDASSRLSLGWEQSPGVKVFIPVIERRVRSKSKKIEDTRLSEYPLKFGISGTGFW